MSSGDPINPGVIPLKGIDADANRDAAGRAAIQEQAPGDEFVIVIPDDLQDCLDRIDEIRVELGELNSKMYNVQMNGAMAFGLGYAGPPAAIKLAIRQDMALLETEETLIQARIYELQWTVPPQDENGDKDEDERERGDPNQPGNYVAGAARDAVNKAIGWPDQPSSWPRPASNPSRPPGVAVPGG